MHGNQGFDLRALGHVSGPQLGFDNKSVLQDRVKGPVGVSKRILVAFLGLCSPSGPEFGFGFEFYSGHELILIVDPRKSIGGRARGLDGPADVPREAREGLHRPQLHHNRVGDPAPHLTFRKLESIDLDTLEVIFRIPLVDDRLA